VIFSGNGSGVESRAEIKILEILLDSYRMGASKDRNYFDVTLQTSTTATALHVIIFLNNLCHFVQISFFVMNTNAPRSSHETIKSIAFRPLPITIADTAGQCWHLRNNGSIHLA
jgi:hypothetical protein